MSSTTTHSDLHWKQADENVYVATRDGEFAGFVELSADAHVVHDDRGAELGAFPTLVEARRALEGGSGRSIRSIRQTLRRHLTRARS